MAVPTQLMDILSQLSPGSANTRGQVSSYQNNGPLNALVHVLVADIDKLVDPGHVAVKQELLNAFAAQHNVYLGWDDFKQAVKELTPIQREVVLGPVLRKLIPTKRDNVEPIAAREVANLAQRFDIKVETYLTPDAFKATKLIPEIKKTAIDTAYAAEIGRRPVGAPPLTAVEQAALRKRISQDFSTPAYATEFQKRAEAEFQRRNALPRGDADRPDANQIPPAILPAGPTIATLKLWQSNDNQYQFDTPNPAEHNSHYASHPFASYEKQSQDVQKVVEKAVAERQAGQPVKLKKAFQQFELEQSKKPGAFADTMQNQVQTMLSGLINTLSFGDKNGPVAFIGQIFSSILGGLFQFLGPLSNMKSMLSNMGKTADSPVDDAEEMRELKEKNPELAVETKEFASLVRKLEEQGDTGAIEARRLNEAWRSAPNTLAVWKDLAVTMVNHGLDDDVDHWMRVKAKKTLNYLIREEERIERASATPDQQTDLHQELNQIQLAFTTFENPELANASPAYQAQNFGVRMRMFERLMEVATNVIPKENEHKKAAESVVQLQQQMAGLERSEQTARAAGAPVAATLTQRLADLQAELTGKTREARYQGIEVRLAKDEARDAGRRGGVPAILTMAQNHAATYQAALQQVHAAAAGRAAAGRRRH